MSLTLLNSEKITLDKDSSEALVGYCLWNSKLTNVLDSENVIINKETARQILSTALDKRNKVAANTLLNHHRAKKYPTKDTQSYLDMLSNRNLSRT